MRLYFFSEWSSWTQWSGCYSLFNGVQQRARLCEGGNSCQGPTFEERECKTDSKLVLSPGFDLDPFFQNKISFFPRSLTTLYLYSVTSGAIGVTGPTVPDPASMEQGIGTGHARVCSGAQHYRTTIANIWARRKRLKLVISSIVHYIQVRIVFRRPICTALLTTMRVCL